jgi:hypothetical protein
VRISVGKIVTRKWRTELLLARVRGARFASVLVPLMCSVIQGFLCPPTAGRIVLAHNLLDKQDYFIYHGSERR